MIIFLDFDGVLHGPDCAETRRCSPTSAKYLKDDEKKWLSTKTWQRVVSLDEPLFKHAGLLSDVLDECAMDIKVVVSSSWRIHFETPRLASFLPASLAQRVIGATSILDASNPDGIRLAEIEDFLNRRAMRGTPWLALDDMPELFVAGRDEPEPANLIWCRNQFDDSAAAELRVKIAALAEAGDRWREALAEAHRTVGEK